MSNQETKEILLTLKRIEELLTTLTKVALSEVVEKVYSDAKHRTIYENVERLTFKQLTNKTGFSTATISRLCQGWEHAGLLRKDGKKYRRLL